MPDAPAPVAFFQNDDVRATAPPFGGKFHRQMPAVLRPCTPPPMMH
jgi:hypothetical protein